MALTNPADIQRHRQFKQDVDDLLKHGYIRHYTAELKRETGENTGNITKYYKGKIPIGNNFLEKFYSAYGRWLKKLRVDPDSTDPKLAVNIPPGLATGMDLPPNTNTASSQVEEPAYPSEFQKMVIEKLTDIQKTLARMEKKKK